MTKKDAEELAERLHSDVIDYELRVGHTDVSGCSVRAPLMPLSWWGGSPDEAKEYALRTFAAMTESGDWDIVGSDGRAYITRY